MNIALSVGRVSSRRSRYCAVVVASIISCLAAPSFAVSTPHVNPVNPVNNVNVGLKPATREQVRAIGQALLQSRRKVQPDQDTVALHKQIDDVHEALAALIAPVTPTVVAEKTLFGISTTSAPTDPWSTAKAAHIKRLRSAVSQLQQQSHALHDKRQGISTAHPVAATTTDFFHAHTPLINQLMPSWHDSNAAPAHPQSVVTPASDVALARFDRLDADITAALALPPTQRQTRLMALTQEFSLSQVAASQFIRRIPTSTDTPTLVSRFSGAPQSH